MTEPERADKGEAEIVHADTESRRGTSLSLLERAKDNDADARRRILHLDSPLVYYWCGRAGIRRPDAEDVLQEVFRAAAARLGDFRRDRPGDTFRGWLRGITRFKVLAHFRGAREEPPSVGGSDAWRGLQEIADPTTASEEEDSPSELTALYHRALELVRSEFEERTWKAFWQVAVEGRSPTEVAANLGGTPAAIRQAKSRILRRLKEEVGDLAQWVRTAQTSLGSAPRLL